MDFNNANTFMKNLKCSICGYYLSYLPIYLTSTNQNICGRCPVTGEEGISVTRNKVFEAVAEEIKFPCRFANEGCVETLYPRHIFNHEELCPFKVIKCPVSEFMNECEERVSYLNLENHCREKHSDIILKKGEFTIDLLESEERNNLLIKNNNFFIFKTKFDCTSTQLTWGVYLFESQDDEYPDLYELCLKSGCRSFTAKGYVEFNSNTFDECDNLSLDMFKNLQHSNIIEGKLTLGDEFNEMWKRDKLSEGLREILKSSSCSRYIQPPDDSYYLSDNNRTKCKSCGAGYPHYYPAMGDGRIIKLAHQELIIPCKYQKNGCRFTGKQFDIEQHQTKCTYENYSCPVSDSTNCKWNGLKKDITSHMTKDHSCLIALNASTFSVQIFDHNSYQNFTKTYIIKFSEYFFRLNFSAKDKCYRWSVQMLGEFQKGFKYELDIFRSFKYSFRVSRSRDDKLSVIKSCLPVTSEKSLFKDVTQYSYFDLNQFEHLLCEGKLEFDIRIFKC